jgi:phosphate transport system permease protein
MELPLASRRLGAGKTRVAEQVFRVVAASAAAALLAVLALMLFKLGQVSAPAWSKEGRELVAGTRWAPTKGFFGGLPFIYGTLVTSVIALVFAVPVGVGTALYVSEFAPRRLRGTIGSLTDLLAAVPSVIYGLWGFFVLAPTLAPFERFLARTLGRFIPIFALPTVNGQPVPIVGIGYLTAGIVLAIMIIPTVSALSREVFLTVPREQREAALAVGATRWEAIRAAVLPAARPGVVGAVILGLGRALGETIAVFIVIGNSPTIAKSLLAPGSTMASIIVGNFSEAGPDQVQALIAIGLLLFGVTFVVNVFARLLVRKRLPT